MSHDHHHALAQARRLEEAVSLSEGATRARAGDDFINFYLGRMLRHFREEEELFFAPLVDHEEASDKVLRALAEHLRVHALARALRRQLMQGNADPTTMTDLSELITAHVRFEERDLFPLVERLISEDDLTDLAEAGRREV
ncbi:MAG: hemerythrin domain-containing protein [Actinomycetota bacterium]